MNSEIKVDKPSPSYLKHSNNGGLFVGFGLCLGSYVYFGISFMAEL